MKKGVEFWLSTSFLALFQRTSSFVNLTQNVHNDLVAHCTGRKMLNSFLCNKQHQQTAERVLQRSELLYEQHQTVLRFNLKVLEHWQCLLYTIVRLSPNELAASCWTIIFGCEHLYILSKWNKRSIFKRNFSFRLRKSGKHCLSELI